MSEKIDPFPSMKVGDLVSNIYHNKVIGLIVDQRRNGLFRVMWSNGVFERHSDRFLQVIKA
jgi:hypothetical protein